MATRISLSVITASPKRERNKNIAGNVAYVESENGNEIIMTHCPGKPALQTGLRFKRLSACAAALALISGAASAEEITQTLIESGGWLAGAHKMSIVSPVDTCIVINTSTGVAFRADADSYDVRLINKKWQLPANVSGNVVFQMANYAKQLPITGNTNDVIYINLEESEIVNMLDAMDKSPDMRVKVGKDAPFFVSLSGSTPATNAFRRCANIRGGGSASPDANPFR